MAYKQKSKRRGRAAGGAQSLARGLGWLSIGIGAIELLAPRALARMFGMRDRQMLVRACGVRGVATGVGILATSNPQPWIKGRIGGDALDIATLAAGFLAANSRRRRRTIGLALAAVAGITALDVICSRQLDAAARRRSRALPDYSSRSGLPRPPDEMRGVARGAIVPQDMVVPTALRPYAVA